MKDKNEFLKQMENLQVPDINPANHQTMVKMAVMNAGRSAALGVWLIIAPCCFLLCVCLYYYFHAQTSWFGSMFVLVISLDKIPYIDYLAPIILFVLPIVAIVINGLAITHIQYNKENKTKELLITIKLKLWNVLLILLSLLIIGAFVNFAMVQSISVSY